MGIGSSLMIIPNDCLNDYKIGQLPSHLGRLLRQCLGVNGPHLCLQLGTKSQLLEGSSGPNLGC